MLVARHAEVKAEWCLFFLKKKMLVARHAEVKAE